MKKEKYRGGEGEVGGLNSVGLQCFCCKMGLDQMLGNIFRISHSEVLLQNLRHKRAWSVFQAACMFLSAGRHSPQAVRIRDA